MDAASPTLDKLKSRFGEGAWSFSENPKSNNRRLVVAAEQLFAYLEFLKTDCMSGDHGLTLTEYAPFGVIGAITPVTHSLPTLAANAMVDACLSTNPRPVSEADLAAHEWVTFTPGPQRLRVPAGRPAGGEPPRGRIELAGREQLQAVDLRASRAEPLDLPRPCH